MVAQINKKSVRYYFKGNIYLVSKTGHCSKKSHQLSPRGLDESAIEEDDVVRAAKQPKGSAVDTAAKATVAEEQCKKKTKKRRRKGYLRFKLKPKGKRNSAYVPVSPSQRKRAPQQRRWRKVLVPAAYKEVDCCVVPQRKMRDCILTYYLTLIGAPPPEEWRGAGGWLARLLARFA